MVEKFVVLSGALNGKHGIIRQTTVIARDDLPDNADMTRLLTIGAVRKATKLEEGLTVVKDALHAPDKSYVEHLADKDAQIKLLREQKDAIESEFAAFKASLKQSEAGAVNVENYKKILAEKDAVIFELQKKMRK